MRDALVVEEGHRYAYLAERPQKAGEGPPLPARLHRLHHVESVAARAVLKGHGRGATRTPRGGGEGDDEG